MDNNAIQTVILLGGQSRRMGRDKALLLLQDQTLLARTITIAEQISPIVWLNTPWREDYQPFLSQTVQWFNDREQAGGLVALQQFLNEIQPNGWVLLLACDLPYLEVNQLQIWCEQLATIPLNNQAALVEHKIKSKQCYEPLCGFYRGTIRDSLNRFVTQGGRSFQQWLATERVFELAIAPEKAAKMLFNCNTPADFATLNTNP